MILLEKAVSIRENSYMCFSFTGVANSVLMFMYVYVSMYVCVYKYTHFIYIGVYIYIILDNLKFIIIYSKCAYLG